MGYPAQGCFNSSGNEGYIRVKRLDDPAVYREGVVRSLRCLSAGGVCVGRPFSFVGGIMIDHRVHIPGGHREEQPRNPQLLKVTKVILPVGLGDNGHPEPFRFQHPADHGSSKGRMIDVCVAGEQDHIQLIPPAFFHLFRGRWQPIRCLALLIKKIRHPCVIVHGAKVSWIY